MLYIQGLVNLRQFYAMMFSSFTSYLINDVSKIIECLQMTTSRFLYYAFLFIIYHLKFLHDTMFIEILVFVNIKNRIFDDRIKT